MGMHRGHQTQGTYLKGLKTCLLAIDQPNTVDSHFSWILYYIFTIVAFCTVSTAVFPTPYLRRSSLSFLSMSTRHPTFHSVHCSPVLTFTPLNPTLIHPCTVTINLHITTRPKIPHTRSTSYLTPTPQITQDSLTSSSIHPSQSQVPHIIGEQQF